VIAANEPTIAANEVVEWSQTAPWPLADQIEQDLVLTRLMIEIANDPTLRAALVMRGGTCLHKLWMSAARYSEDLDYVRTTSGPIGHVLDALRALSDRVGFTAFDTQIGRHPKARFRWHAVSGNRLSIKVEMNTFERSPARQSTTRPITMSSQWFSGTAQVPTFVVEELIATKIRALYQRTKGRDLFDLWLAVHQLGVKPSEIAACFGPYCPPGWTPAPGTT
jgi:predicted nucleotidyltransferase component of viral defense system